MPGVGLKAAVFPAGKVGRLKLLAPILVAVRAAFLWIFAKFRWLIGTNTVFFGTIS
jgi:hypothetical protein